MKTESFNQTIVELKWQNKIPGPADVFAFNQTIVELK